MVQLTRMIDKYITLPMVVGESCCVEKLIVSLVAGAELDASMELD